MPYIIALDLDGTLLRSDGVVSQRNSAAVARRKALGDQIVIATSRPRRSVLTLLPPDFQTDAWICYNGAEVYEQGALLKQWLLPPRDLHSLVDQLLSYAPDLMISVECDDRLLSNQPLIYPWEHEVVSLPELMAQPVAKLLFDASRIPDMPAFRANLPDHCSFVVTDAGTLGHLMAPNVSKAQGMAYLLQHWRRDFADVIAFGDDLNDCELLAASGIGVAMGNARAETRAVANRSTLSNDEDGVAVTLESLT